MSSYCLIRSRLCGVNCCMLTQYNPSIERTIKYFLIKLCYQAYQKKKQISENFSKNRKKIASAKSFCKNRKNSRVSATITNNVNKITEVNNQIKNHQIFSNFKNKLSRISVSMCLFCYSEAKKFKTKNINSLNNCGFYVIAVEQQ